MNMIIGLSAAGGFLLACIIMFAVNYAFCKSDDDTEDEFDVTPNGDIESVIEGYELPKKSPDLHKRNATAEAGGSKGEDNHVYIEDTTNL